MSAILQAKTDEPANRNEVPFLEVRGLEKRFGGVDVADADDDPLVHQEGLHRRAAAAGARMQGGAVAGVGQGDGAEPPQ